MTGIPSAMYGTVGSLKIFLLGLVVLGIAVLAVGGGYAQAAALDSELPARFVAEDAPATDDGGDDDSSSEEEPDPEPEPIPEPEPEPEPDPEPEPVQPEDEPRPNPAPIAESNSDSKQAPLPSDETDSKDSASGRHDGRNTDSDDEDAGGVGAGPADVSGPLRPLTDASSPGLELAADDGPSPLGWILLAAGMACGVAAFMVYRGNRPIDDAGAWTAVSEPTEYVDPIGPNTVEIRRVEP